MRKLFMKKNENNDENSNKIYENSLENNEISYGK